MVPMICWLTTSIMLLLSCLQLPHLKTLYFQDYYNSNANPVCQHEAYVPTITANAPNLLMLDGASIELRAACEPLERTVKAIADICESMKAPSHNFEVDSWLPASVCAIAEEKGNDVEIANAEMVLQGTDVRYFLVRVALFNNLTEQPKQMKLPERSKH